MQTNISFVLVLKLQNVSRKYRKSERTIWVD
jgi:hypothetical protein